MERWVVGQDEWREMLGAKAFQWVELGYWRKW